MHERVYVTIRKRGNINGVRSKESRRAELQQDKECTSADGEEASFEKVEKAGNEELSDLDEGNYLQGATGGQKLEEPRH